jgi:hypothetical protein
MSFQWKSPKAEAIFAILLTVAPLGLSNEMSVASRCVCWAVAWCFLLHLALTHVPFAARWPKAVSIAVTVFLTSLLFAFSYSPVVRAWNREQAALMSGELVMDSLDFNNPLPVIQIGPEADGTRFNWAGPEGQPEFKFFGETTQVRKVDGKTLVSTRVRDQSGAVVVDIEDNKWRVSPEPHVSWDKNYTKNALEVMDGRGRVVFQVIVFSDSARIQGEWWTEDKRGMRLLRPFPFDRKKTGPVFVVLTPTSHPSDPRIGPMFKYPSSEHWGEFADWVRP